MLTAEMWFATAFYTFLLFIPMQWGYQKATWPTHKILYPFNKIVNSGEKKVLGNREATSVYTEKTKPSPAMLNFQEALGYTGGGGVSAFSPFASLGQTWK